MRAYPSLQPTRAAIGMVFGMEVLAEYERRSCGYPDGYPDTYAALSPPPREEEPPGGSGAETDGKRRVRKEEMRLGWG